MKLRHVFGIIFTITLLSVVVCTKLNLLQKQQPEPQAQSQPHELRRDWQLPERSDLVMTEALYQSESMTVVGNEFLTNHFKSLGIKEQGWDWKLEGDNKWSNVLIRCDNLLPDKNQKCMLAAIAETIQKNKPKHSYTLLPRYTGNGGCGVVFTIHFDSVTVHTYGDEHGPALHAIAYYTEGLKAPMDPKGHSSNEIFRVTCDKSDRTDTMLLLSNFIVRVCHVMEDE
jgi:hypothetical protein